MGMGYLLVPDTDTGALQRALCLVLFGVSNPFKTLKPRDGFGRKAVRLSSERRETCHWQRDGSLW